MIARRAFCVLIGLCALALAGCNSGEGVGATPGQTHLRVINLVPNAPAITVQLDSNSPLVTNLPFQQQTGYLNVDGGTHEFKVSVAGNPTAIVDISGTLVTGTNSTFIVYGPVEAAGGLVVLDPINLVPNGGTFAVRVINVAQGSVAVDLYLTPPGTDINATGPAVTGVAAGKVGVFTVVNTGNYQLRITPAGAKQVIYDSGVVVPFADKSLSEAIVYTTGSSALVGAALLNIDDQGSGQVYESALAEFKLLNGSQVPSPLNVFVDGVLALANIPFAGVSDYQVVAAGTHQISVQAAATPGANLLTVTTKLSPSSDTSIAVSGPAGALQALVLADNNLPAALGHARIRFVNALPDLPAMDVYVNFVKTFGSVASNSASGYTEIQADVTTTTNYEFGFNAAGTGNVVLQLSSVPIAAGKTYSVYVVGSSAAAQGVVVADD